MGHQVALNRGVVRLGHVNAHVKVLHRVILHGRVVAVVQGNAGAIATAVIDNIIGHGRMVGTVKVDTHLFAIQHAAIYRQAANFVMAGSHVHVTVNVGFRVAGTRIAAGRHVPVVATQVQLVFVDIHIFVKVTGSHIHLRAVHRGHIHTVLDTAVGADVNLIGFTGQGLVRAQNNLLVEVGGQVAVAVIVQKVQRTVAILAAGINLAVQVDGLLVLEVHGTAVIHPAGHGIGAVGINIQRVASANDIGHPGAAVGINGTSQLHGLAGQVHGAAGAGVATGQGLAAKAQVLVGLHVNGAAVQATAAVHVHRAANVNVVCHQRNLAIVVHRAVSLNQAAAVDGTIQGALGALGGQQYLAAVGNNAAVVVHSGSVAALAAHARHGKADKVIAGQVKHERIRPAQRHFAQVGSNGAVVIHGRGHQRGITAVGHVNMAIVGNGSVRVAGLVKFVVAAHEIGVTDVGSGRHQAAYVHLAVGAEHHAVRIDEHQLSVGVKRSQNG